MASPSALSLNEIRKFILNNGGKVTNHSLVKHFKPFLTDSDTRDAARATFKQYVNKLASVKMENDEKFIVLKEEYFDDFPEEETKPKPLLVRQKSLHEDEPPELPMRNYTNVAPVQPQQYSQEQFVQPQFIQQQFVQPNRIVDEAPTLPHNFNSPRISNKNNNGSELSETYFENSQNSIASMSALSDNSQYYQEDAPMERPRKIDSIQKDNVVSGSMTSLTDSDQVKLSVKEGIKKFNKTQTDGMHMPRQPSRKHRGGDDDDKTSVALLDQASHTWITLASQGDYARLAKMASESPKLLTLKDPFLTALHWAAKKGSEDLVKLLAGFAPELVHKRSIGGYTPLHIAMQHKHENLGNLLKDVYGADPDLRDYAGKKPRDYLKNEDAVIPPESYRRNKHKKKKYNEKDLGFLRIGSLNMRVKKTTEAFSNFLGVGAGSRGFKSSQFTRNGSPMEMMPEDSDEVIGETWGSEDNIRNEKGKVLMPPPLFTKIKRKKKTTVNRPVSNPIPQSRSTPSTPNEVRSVFNEDVISNKSDFSGSDSDTACGFDENWQRK